MFSAIKAALMLSFVIVSCTNTFIVLIIETINNINSCYCNECKCKIEKSNLHNKLKTIFYIPYKDSLCVDCFIKKYNLEHVLDTFDKFTLCSCGSTVSIKKHKYYWSIKCDNCINEIVDPTLNGCFEKWEII